MYDFDRDVRGRCVTEMKSRENTPRVRQTAPNQWHCGEATLVVEHPAPSVLVYRFSGRMVPGLVPKIREVAGAALRTEGSVALFFDTEDMTGYHPEFRDQMTTWHGELKRETRTAGVLVRSRVIGMAIAVANLATGGKLESFSDRRAFEAAIGQAVDAAPTR